MFGASLARGPAASPAAQEPASRKGGGFSVSPATPSAARPSGLRRHHQITGCASDPAHPAVPDRDCARQRACPSGDLRSARPVPPGWPHGRTEGPAEPTRQQITGCASDPPWFSAPFGLGRSGSTRADRQRLRLRLRALRACDGTTRSPAAPATRLTQPSRIETAPASGLALRATFGRLDPCRPVGLMAGPKALRSRPASRSPAAPATRLGFLRPSGLAVPAQPGLIGRDYAFGCAPFGLATAPPDHRLRQRPGSPSRPGSRLRPQAGLPFGRPSVGSTRAARLASWQDRRPHLERPPAQPGPNGQRLRYFAPVVALAFGFVARPFRRFCPCSRRRKRHRLPCQCGLNFTRH